MDLKYQSDKYLDNTKSHKWTKGKLGRNPQLWCNRYWAGKSIPAVSQGGIKARQTGTIHNVARNGTYPLSVL